MRALCVYVMWRRDAVTLGNAPVSIYPVWKWSQRRENFIFATRTTHHDRTWCHKNKLRQCAKRKSESESLWRGTKNSKWAWMEDRQTDRERWASNSRRWVDYSSCSVAIEFHSHSQSESQSLLPRPLCRHSRSIAYILTVTPNICSTLNDYKKIVEAIFTKHNIPSSGSSSSKRCLWFQLLLFPPPFPPFPHKHSRKCIFNAQAAVRICIARM